MSYRVVHRGALLGALLGALVVASSASAATFRGVVVHRNARAHSFAVALKGGRLVAVHARRAPAVGKVVVVSARRLRNGTFAARRVRSVGRSRRAAIRGVVTFVNRRRGVFTVSSRGASLLIHSRRGARVADALPAVGQSVQVEAQIGDQGDLEQQTVQSTGSQTQNIDLEGTVLAVDTTARTLSVSADDDGQSGQSVTVVVPATINISAFTVGQEVELVVSLQPDGSFLLQGSSGDDNAQQANNPSDQQGCEAEGGDSSTGTSCSSASGSSTASGAGSSGSAGSDTSSASTGSAGG